MPKLLRLEVFSQSTRFYELIFAYCFYAGASAGMVSGGMSGEQAFFFFFYCSQLTWYLLVVVPMLPIPQDGLFKELLNFSTMNTPRPGGQGHMHA
jgi:putative hemolysin